MVARQVLRWGRALLGLALFLALVGAAEAGRRHPAEARKLFGQGWEWFRAQVHAIRPPARPMPRVRRLPAVRLLDVRPGPYARIRRYHGEIEANRESKLAFEVSGRVRTMSARENARVDEGATLAELDTALYVARRDQAAAMLDKATRDLARAEELRRTHVAPQRQLDDARSELALRRAQLDEATKTLERTVLKAPFAGRVVRRHVEQGEMVSPGQPAFVLMELDPAVLVVWVPGYRVPELAVGQRCTVELTAFPGKPRDGRVRRVPLAGERGRLFGVEIELANPDRDLRPGMIGFALVRTRRLARAWSFPLHCVRSDDGGLEVCGFRADDDDPATVRGSLVVHRLVDAFRDGDRWIARALDPPAESLRLIEAGHVGLAAGTVVRRVGPVGK